MDHPLGGISNPSWNRIPHSYKATLPCILQKHSYYEIFTGIIKHLSMFDILNLSATCKSLAHVKQEYWDINGHLSQFVDNKLHFRGLMAKHDAIVSGSNALQFFEHCYWEGSDLDLYVSSHESPNGIVEFIDYLVEEEGYILRPYEWQKWTTNGEFVKNTLNLTKFLKSTGKEKCKEDPPVNEKDEQYASYGLRNISGVFSLKRKSTSKVIQVIATKDIPITTIINDYYATAIVNFYSWNRAYSLFPLLTFRRRVSLIVHFPHPKQNRGLKKYKAGGYTNVKEMDEEIRFLKNNPVRGARRVGDRFSWVLNLDTSGIDRQLAAAATPDHVLDCSCFGISYNAFSRDWGNYYTDHRCHYAMWCRVFRSPILRYAYPVEEYEGINCWSWYSELLACTRPLEYDNIATVKSAYRNGKVSYANRILFPKLKGFLYFDDNVVGWCNAWERGEGKTKGTETKLEATREPPFHRIILD